MMILRASCAITVLVLCGVACGGGSSSESLTSEEVVVTLDEQNGSAESGTATLTAVGDKTRVVLELQSRSATPIVQRQPAHIHKGSCAKLNATPAYGLRDVKGGKSTTTVAAKLTDLRNGAFVINVHESATEIKRYVACGVVGAGDGKDYDPLGHDKEADY